MKSLTYEWWLILPQSKSHGVNFLESEQIENGELF